jgi:hypothetical protein
MTIWIIKEIYNRKVYGILLLVREGVAIPIKKGFFGFRKYISPSPERAKSLNTG